MKNNENFKNVFFLSHLWKFEKLKNSNNWKMWNRNVRNVLHIMSILYVITNDLSIISIKFINFAYKIVDNFELNNDDKSKMINMITTKRKILLKIWIKNIKRYVKHNRLIWNYIYNKFIIEFIWTITNKIYVICE